MLACPCLDKTIIPANVDINAVTNFLQTLSANAQKRIDGTNGYYFSENPEIFIKPFIFFIERR